MIPDSPLSLLKLELVRLVLSYSGQGISLCLESGPSLFAINVKRAPLTVEFWQTQG